MAEKEIGRVEDYFSHIGVMAVRLTDSLSVGDRIRIKGHTTDFSQEVTSIQIEHQDVQKAEAGDDVGIRVTEKVRPGDHLYKIEAE